MNPTSPTDQPIDISRSRRPSHGRRRAQALAASAETQHRRGIRPSARELFAILRTPLLSQRPLVTPDRQVAHVRTKGARRGQIVMQRHPAVYGPTTFRNVIERDDFGNERLV